MPTVFFIFGGTQFGYFTLPTESINWVDAETSCMAWNGHLATIRSRQEDTLLLHSILSIQTVSCFIGLNDRENDAVTNARTNELSGLSSDISHYQQNLSIG